MKYLKKTSRHVHASQGSRGMSMVLPLRNSPDGPSMDDRACTAMRMFLRGIDELRAIRDEQPSALVVFLPEIEEAATDIPLLLARLRMKHTTSQLCNHFGRPAP